MTCSLCKCPNCREASKTELKSVLSRRIVSRETQSPRDLPFVEACNVQALQSIRAKEEWRDTEVRGVRDLGQRIERTRAELRTVKPRSRRRVELELSLRDLMLILLRRENRAARKRVA